MKDILEGAYAALEGSEVAEAYSERHGIKSAAVLTVYDDEMAGNLAEHLAPRIMGKTVVEIGGGIGLLSMHLGFHAKRVFCIEASPAWSWAFVGCLFAGKPKNVSFLFGAAEEFVGLIKADVAICCTHSDVTGLREIGLKFAPEYIDVYGEMIAANPGAFDETASFLRGLS